MANKSVPSAVSGVTPSLLRLAFRVRRSTFDVRPASINRNIETSKHRKIARSQTAISAHFFELLRIDRLRRMKYMCIHADLLAKIDGIDLRVIASYCELLPLGCPDHRVPTPLRH